MEEENKMKNIWKLQNQGFKPGKDKFQLIHIWR